MLWLRLGRLRLPFWLEPFETALGFGLAVALLLRGRFRQGAGLALAPRLGLAEVGDGEPLVRVRSRGFVFSLWVRRFP